MLLRLLQLATRIVWWLISTCCCCCCCCVVLLLLLYYRKLTAWFKDVLHRTSMQRMHYIRGISEIFRIIVICKCRERYIFVIIAVFSQLGINVIYCATPTCLSAISRSSSDSSLVCHTNIRYIYIYIYIYILFYRCAWVKLTVQVSYTQWPPNYELPGDRL